MVNQLYALREAGITNAADVRLLSVVTEHMLFQNNRLSEATIANIAFVRTNVVVHPETVVIENFDSDLVYLELGIWNETLTSYEVCICLFLRTPCYKLNK